MIDGVESTEVEAELTSELESLNRRLLEVRGEIGSLEFERKSIERQIKATARELHDRRAEKIRADVAAGHISGRPKGGGGHERT